MLIDCGFIHLFKTAGYFYMFDVNTDKIIKIPQNIYEDLSGQKDCREISKETTGYIEKLRAEGYMKNNKVINSVHPLTDYIQFYMQNKVNSITLQVTQNCNLRCSYCVYSGSYKNRTHSNKRMSFELAKKGIDFMISKSKDATEFHIGFYGGEPLLEFELIKQCVEYSLLACNGKKIYFNITTNGTLFNEDVLDFFEKYNITAMISIDGPAEVHDKNRRFASNNCGSHATIVESIRSLKELKPKYFKEHVHFNTVIDPENNFSCVDHYISTDELFNDTVFLSSFINDTYTEKTTLITESFIEERQYEVFKLFLQKLGRISEDQASRVLKMDASQIGSIRKGKKREGQRELPTTSHHGGPCLPGVFRLFMNVTGDFYPCEKVSESSLVSKIGDVDSGFDIEKIKDIINIEKITSDHCQNCWAYNYCTVCIACADNITEISRDLILKQCKDVKYRVESTFKDYCVLSELGHDFDAI